ncbi:MAG: hypothetical protein ACRDRL_32755 [Sciscionella sp.]
MASFRPSAWPSTSCVGREGPVIPSPRAEIQTRDLPVTRRSPRPCPDIALTAESAAKLVSEVRDDVARLKWFLRHGNVFRALQAVDGFSIDLETLDTGDEPSKLLKAVHEFDSYLRANAERIPNHGERRRAGDAIRARVLNDQLTGDFHRWYPGFSRAPDPVPLAA